MKDTEIRCTAAQWIEKGRLAAEAYELSLPSGMVVRARRPGPIQIAYWRPFLEPRVQSESQRLSQEEIRQSAVFMRDLLTYCLLTPRISLEPLSEEEIHPRNIPDGDWQFILRWAMRLEQEKSAMAAATENLGAL